MGISFFFIAIGSFVCLGLVILILMTSEFIAKRRYVKATYKPKTTKRSNHLRLIKPDNE